jgi:hypothetical protein
MKWTDALKQAETYIRKQVGPATGDLKLTNRNASGLIFLLRSIYRTNAQRSDVALTPFDWYAFALPALAWSKPGDRFKVDTAHQLNPYAFTPQLWTALTTLAAELDAANVPQPGMTSAMFEYVRPTDKTFRRLALDAWDAMKNLGHEASKLPGEQPPPALVETWTAQLGPQGAATVASSASSAAAAAAAPRSAQPDPEQLPLPGVPQVLPPPKAPDPEEYGIQPVPRNGNGNGGGKRGGIGGGIGLILIALLAFAGKRKRGR